MDFVCRQLTNVEKHHTLKRKLFLSYHFQFGFLKWLKVWSFLSFQNILIDGVSASNLIAHQLLATHRIVLDGLRHLRFLKNIKKIIITYIKNKLKGLT
jgi:hypothetical protein